MAEGLNRVILLGNLGADPELKVTQGGASVLKLRLATTEKYVDRDGAKQERTEWHAITIWGKRGEALNRFLTKGSRILVEGSLRTTSYEDRDGNKRFRTEIVASNVVFAGGGGAPRSRSSSSEGDFDPPPAPRAASSHDSPPETPDYSDIDNEIPF